MLRRLPGLCSRSALGYVVLVTLACRPPTSSGDGETGEPEPQDEYEPPVFVDPASGVLTLDHSERDDIALRVTAYVPGRTQLEIDGQSVGTLVQPSPIGQFIDETLRMPIEGAMIRGSHTLRLVTPGTVRPQISAPVEVKIVPSPTPTLAYELGNDVIGEGEHVNATRTLDQGLLSIVDVTGPGQATLHMLRANKANWIPGDIRSLELPGYLDFPEDRQAAASAAFIDEDRIRVAWRVGKPGARIQAVELRWGAEDNVVGEVLTAIEGTGLPGYEWSSVGRPLVVGNHVIAHAYTAADTEKSLPGDRALLLARWPLGADTPNDAQRLNFGQSMDLDTVGPAIDLLRHDDDRALLRLDRRLPAFVEWESTGITPVQIDAALGNNSVKLIGEPFSVAGITGAFGSRTLAAAYPSGTVRVQLIDAIGDKRSRAANPPTAQLPEDGPTGPLAVTAAEGSAVFLLPYGIAHAVRALVVDGDATEVQTLEGLFCDEIAVPASAEGNDSGSMSFACVQDGEVRLGALFAGG